MQITLGNDDDGDDGDDDSHVNDDFSSLILLMIMLVTRKNDIIFPNFPGSQLWSMYDHKVSACAQNSQVDTGPITIIHIYVTL